MGLLLIFIKKSLAFAWASASAHDIPKLSCGLIKRPGTFVYEVAFR